jgi:leucyl aminopeptidase
MDYQIKTITDLAALKTDCLVFAIAEGKAQSASAKAVDRAAEGRLSELIKHGDIKPAPAKSAVLHQLPNVAAQRIVVVGLGAERSIAKSRQWLAAAVSAALATPAKDATIVLTDLVAAEGSKDGVSAEWLAQQAAQLCEDLSYRYDHTLSKKADKPALKKLTLVVEKAGKALQAGIDRGAAIGRGMNVTKQLGNLPGNICTPTFLAEEARHLAKKYSTISTDVLDEKQMQKLGMGSLLSVSAGSEQPAKLIVMHYKGGSKSAKPHVLVGKGITFDTGGISLKPGAKMEEMKFDMCGAASVFGTLTAIAEMKLKINVVGIVAAAENMPSGKATKPGDIVTSMSGQTIEIINTDAEGRLVLCDALTYAARFKPETIVDIATLTGACIVALGKHPCGLFTNDDALAQALLDAGNSTFDRAWRMPLWDDYQSQLDSPYADMQNVGGPEAGSVTAACFLSRYTKEQRWAHLDIAGVAWGVGGSKGASGRPVPLLSQYLINAATA